MTWYCIELDYEKGNSSDFEITNGTPYIALTGSYDVSIASAMENWKWDIQSALYCQAKP